MIEKFKKDDQVKIKKRGCKVRHGTIVSVHEFGYDAWVENSGYYVDRRDLSDGYATMELCFKVKRLRKVGDFIEVNDKAAEIVANLGNGSYGFRYIRENEDRGAGQFYSKTLDPWVIVETSERPYPFEAKA
jgi:hypothetical protein